MASLFGHAAAAVAIAAVLRPRRSVPRRFWALAVLGALLPDADVLGFRLGIAYGDPLGHRGLTHSLAAAAVWAAAAGLAFRAEEWRPHRRPLLLCLFAAAASHGLLDMLTDGGLGVALFGPFSWRRYFFPWTPIRVSPLGFTRFLTPEGAAVLASEMLWIGVPVALLLACRWWKDRAATGTRAAG
jgi:inner membrane protein